MACKLRAAVSALLCALCAATPAFAQAPAPPPAGAAGAPEAAPPLPAPPAPAPGALAAPVTQQGKARFRWGISGFYGRYFYGGQNGGFGGIDTRFGAQLNDHLALYGAPILGFGSSTSYNGMSTSGLVLFGAGFLADYTADNMFFVAGGPEFLLGGGASSSVVTDGTTSVELGSYLGLEARAGIALGSVHPWRRSAFTMSLDFHAVFMSKPTVIPMITLGYDSF